jgi:two-component system alkaline phosphatase synthesis response regulator PhoP
MANFSDMTKQNKKTILIVDDEEEIREIYKTKLSRDGYRVIAADSGTKGAEMALEKRPDLILLDIVLPMKEGFSVLEDLKKNPKTKKIPVIIFSNLNQDYEEKMAKELGAEAYLVKTNVTPEEVVGAVENILDKK